MIERAWHAWSLAQLVRHPHSPLQGLLQGAVYFSCEHQEPERVPTEPRKGRGGCFASLAKDVGGVAVKHSLMPSSVRGVMKKLQSTYPLGQAVISIFKSAGLKLPDFIRAIGYRNTNKGIRALQLLLSDGVMNSVFIERLLASPYSPKAEALLVVVQQHFEQIEQESLIKRGMEDAAREREFCPFVHAIPSLSGSSTITLFALSGGFGPYKIYLPHCIARWSQPQQLQLVGRRIRENFARVGGEIKFLGPIRYYLFFHAWDQSPLALTGDGELLGIADGAAVPAVEYKIKSRLVESKLLERILFSGYGSDMH